MKSDRSGLIYIGGEVLRGTRDKLAALARAQGRTVAALVREWAEAVTETNSVSPADLGDAPRITLRLSLTLARALEQAAASHRMTPGDYTRAVMEAHLLNRLHWDADHLRELQAIRVLLGNAGDDIRRSEIARHLDRVVAGNLAYWSAIAPPVGRDQAAHGQGAASS